jgi:hypothetical protein
MIVALMVTGLYFLNWINGLSKKMKRNKIFPKISNLNNRDQEKAPLLVAVIIGAAGLKFGIRLDYTENGLQKLETIYSMPMNHIDKLQAI